jgi:hypothetical protein
MSDTHKVMIAQILVILSLKCNCEIVLPLMDMFRCPLSLFSSNARWEPAMFSFNNLLTATVKTNCS